MGGSRYPYRRRYPAHARQVRAPSERRSPPPRARRFLWLLRQNHRQSRRAHGILDLVDVRLDRKPIELVIETHPGMPRRLPYGYRRARHRRVSERAKGDAGKVREAFRIPKHRGAAARAEMKFDLSPRVAAAHVDLARPLGAHPLFREIGADAKGRSGTSLALR